MDIRQLRYFVSVAEDRSFTEAAKRLFISQPSLSQQIADLERSIGVKLFDRNRHAVVQLTPGGQALFKEATALLAHAEEAVKIVKRVDSGITGTLRIGFLGLAERNFLPRLISRLHQKYPELELNLIPLPFAQLDKALLRGDIDAGFTLMAAFEKKGSPHLAHKTIYTDILCLIVPLDHPLAKESTIDLSAITEPIICISEEEGGRGTRSLLKLCTTHGISCNLFKSHPETLLLAVESGEGIAILPRTVPEIYFVSPNLRFINIEGPDATVYSALMWKNENSNPYISLFLEELEAII